MTRKRFAMYALGAAVAVTTLACLRAEASVKYNTRALTGDAAPGTGPGVVFSSFGFPLISDAGQTAFTANLTGTGVGVSNNKGVWTEVGGSLGLIARRGDPALGTETGVVYEDFSSLTLFSRAGQVAFHSTMDGPDLDFTNDRAAWAQSSGTLRLIVRNGDPVPGMDPGVKFQSAGIFGFNGAGQSALSGTLEGPGVNFSNDRGIWLESGGSIDLITREGEHAPGTAAGVVYDRIYSPVFNDTGRSAFSAIITGPGVDISNNSGLWWESSGSRGLIAREGTAAPDTEPGVVFKQFSFSPPDLNGAGHVVIKGFLTGSAVNNTNDRGIWSNKSGSLRLVARNGDPAPGTDTGVVYLGLGASPLQNRDSKIAFTGGLAGPGVNQTNDGGVWSDGLGPMTLVARFGDVAPGPGPEVIFDSIEFSNLVLGGSGQIAFLGRFKSLSVGGGSGKGIWATDPNGALTLIARTGDLFDINNDPLIDDLRTIDSVLLINGSDGEGGRATSLNNAGQLTFKLGFPDGSQGVFVATIPEPASLALLASGGLALLRRRVHSN